MKYTLCTILIYMLTNLSLAGDNKDTPRCNENGRFALSLRKFGGMASYMALLEAKREKYEVRVEGLNTCGNHWKSEDVLDIQIR